MQAEAGHLASTFDQALIAMAAAEVQMRAGGDPEIIAAAAGYAVYHYAQGFVALEPWERDQAQMDHWHDFTMAAEIANVAHLALGQHDRAKAVRQLIEQGGAVRHEWPGADLIRQLRQRPTLPAVLAKVAPELNARLPGLAGASVPMVPVLRVRLESAPDVATELAQLAEAALDRGDMPSGMRLALDAHLLFAATSLLGTNKMRYQFHRYGAAWARVLYRAGRQWFDDGNGSDAADASGWLTGVADILFMHAVYDVEIRSLIATWLRWQHELYTSLGDTESVANVARATATLATFGTGGSP
ncbi:hypothetical protein [Solwaraspora sp. WMMD792]|uniref:hypothetical protein n=1 Tax=Solwaraspora sp. WMMD792 TaxID=3016099 RepID=UPI002417B746|nr:hypothetical protein [Solwaraspora sp. WMMD792]MDG4770343.1 hypothetical protein [Solwaraspora sp. WMMD792]